MSDENILAAIASLRTDIEDRLTALEAGQKSLEAGQKSLRDDLTARMDHIQNDMMVRINSQFDRILDTPTANRQDGDTTKGHLIFALQENLTLSQRITKLEEEARKPR